MPNKVNLFDRFIDQFSARELKTRVWAVVLLGFALIGIGCAAGWLLLTHEFFVADEPGLEAVRLIRLLFKGM
jgi:hypothetical protein